MGGCRKTPDTRAGRDVRDLDKVEPRGDKNWLDLDVFERSQRVCCDGVGVIKEQTQVGSSSFISTAGRGHKNFPGQ